MTRFYSCHKTGFGGQCIGDACIDLIPCFKVYNLVSVHPKSIKLGQMTNLNELSCGGVSL